ncbi:hypothetical protein BGZ76_003218, partial [Entomortierella beljakovae]
MKIISITTAVIVVVLGTACAAPIPVGSIVEVPIHDNKVNLDVLRGATVKGVKVLKRDATVAEIPIHDNNVNVDALRGATVKNVKVLQRDAPVANIPINDNDVN